MTPLSQWLAAQRQRIAAGYTGLDADMVTAFDADPVPAALTAEGVPVFRSVRTGQPSTTLPHLRLSILAACGGDAARAAAYCRVLACTFDARVTQ